MGTRGKKWRHLMKY